jgi:hypothetical protein
MNARYREALPLLHNILKFQLEEISSLDLFYTDGDPRVRESFFKLVISREKSSVTVVYIQEKTFWVSFGSLSEAQSQALDHWMQDL